MIGQIEGGTAQGLGFALMEEIQLEDGQIRERSFTDYLIPTILDMPPVDSCSIEEPEPDAPFGAKGVGEPPTIVAPAAIVAALRAALGRRPQPDPGDARTTSSGLREPPGIPPWPPFPDEAGARAGSPAAAGLPHRRGAAARALARSLPERAGDALTPARNRR